MKKMNKEYYINLQQEQIHYEETKKKYYIGTQFEKNKILDEYVLNNIVSEIEKNKIISDIAFSYKDKKLDYDKLINMGNRLMDMKDYNLAKKCFNKAIKINDVFYAAYLNLGVLHKRKEEFR